MTKEKTAIFFGGTPEEHKLAKQRLKKQGYTVTCNPHSPFSDADSALIIDGVTLTNKMAIGVKIAHCCSRKE